MAPVSTKMAANDFLNFVNASPTPFHAVKSVKEKLHKAGFKEIKVGTGVTQCVQLLNQNRRKNRGRRLANLEANTT